MSTQEVVSVKAARRSHLLGEFLKESKALRSEEVVIDRATLNINELLADHYENAKMSTGTALCSVSELVDKKDMVARGFEVVKVEGDMKDGFKNTTFYFIKADSDYVYAECYFSNYIRCCRLIISKSIFEKLGLRKLNAICLKVGTGDGTRCVTYVTLNSKPFKLHNAFSVSVGEEVDHKQISLNLITNESLRAASTALNQKNKIYANHVSMMKNGHFGFVIKENPKILSDADIKELQDPNGKNYTIKIGSRNELFLSKEFTTELEGLQEQRAYEEKYYGEFAYNPINDMRGRFELKFQQLIMQSISERKVIDTILEEYKNNAYSVQRYNLMPLYEKYHMDYNKGKSAANKEFLSL
ncbi:hypothetical protein [[Clostridium] fimetarium]|uniref:Uncharacterized protein n=1 Tax=[Clostridium] fimetarium TaxID=99656 RepID=A0A1I0RDS1_9FIRM|nr:hypothetical protein [[Clostridium] fimetarium]SEW39012.1 hypothetical protein SAMN05421659_11480 [[Clostridium] fimetarium]